MKGKTFQFPAQKKLLAEKTETWGIENIEAGISIANNDNSKLRKSKASKKINYDLINGIIDESDIENAFNPMGIKGVSFPAKIQNYPIEISKFNVLKGEEAKRRFDWRLRSVNEDVISQKEFQLKQEVEGLLMDEITSSDYSEEMATKRMKQLQHYHKYDYQDMGEVMGTRILDYFWYTQKMKSLYSDNFYHVLIGAEEIYSCDIVHGEPQLTKKHPLNISTIGSGDSYHIEDSDIIVDDGFHTVGKVIDLFWDVLKPGEVDTLETGSRNIRNFGDLVYPGPIDVEQELVELGSSQLISVDGNDTNTFGAHFDSEGNVRVTRVIWKSRRKIGQLTYYDPNGDEQTTVVDEKFPIGQFKKFGWTIDWKWINEWWQGYKIAHDMYKRIEPLPRIGSKISNPSICLPPIVGTIYSTGSGPGISLMDRIKPYKYLYNVYMRRTELASARNKGVLAELDLADIPDGWDEDLVMMFAEANGYLVHDSFKESSKGSHQGKLISSIKQRGPATLNLNSSDIIRANLELARYVKIELGEIAGISPQREGQVDNRETLGGVERAVTQSSHITEEWFRVHDLTKVRAMELVLETAKYAWRNYTGDNLKKLQYVDDGLITHMFTVDGREFAASEYGYYISDGQNDAELIQAIKMLSQAALQNDKATFKDIFTIYRDSSVSSMVRKLEDSEERKEQKEDSIRQEQLEAGREQNDMLMKIEDLKMKQELKIEMGKIDADIYKAELTLQGELAKVEASIDDSDSDEDLKKRKHEIEKLRMQLEDKKKERDNKDQQFNKMLEQKKKESSAKIQSSEKIAKMRRKPQTINK